MALVRAIDGLAKGSGVHFIVDGKQFPGTVVSVESEKKIIVKQDRAFYTIQGRKRHLKTLPNDNAPEIIFTYRKSKMWIKQGDTQKGCVLGHGRQDGDADV